MNHNNKETCGRYVTKPDNKAHQDQVELCEEAVPITQQIENLRTKITLQERYNAALKDTMEEASEGTFSVLRDMLVDVFNLRLTLKDAVNRERFAVNNALRTHRLFQLALKKASPHSAMLWMDDKLFDNTKILNEHIDRLIKKRAKLESSEAAVTLIEKWPIPGSQPWELQMAEKMKNICVSQTNIIVKLECAKQLHCKYIAIRDKLQDEQNLYAPIVRNLNLQLSFQLHELHNLEQMLGDAEKFKTNAETALVGTEKEASTNRRQRRAHIARMRKEMQKLVQQEQMSLQGKPNRNRTSYDKEPNESKTIEKKVAVYEYQSVLLADDVEHQQNERITLKRAEIDKFNDDAAMLVHIMKIPNLTHIPKRLETVLRLNETLQSERNSKENLKNSLIKQKDQLSQLFCIIRYTGNGQLEGFNMVIEDYQQVLLELHNAIQSASTTLNLDASLIDDIQLGVSTLLARVEGLDKKPMHVRNSENLQQMIIIFYDKLRYLTQSLTELRKEVKLPDETGGVHKRHLTQHLLVTPTRYLRVGDPSLEEMEASDDEDYDDFKVPGRHEIKHQSAKVVEQFLLRRGIASQQSQQGVKQKAVDPGDSRNSRNEKEGFL